MKPDFPKLPVQASLFLCLFFLSAILRGDDRNRGEKSQDDKKANETSRLIAVLESRSIKATTESVREFLVAATADRTNDQVAKELIRRLSSDLYADRMDAQRQLICLPQLPIDLLQRAVQSHDREQAYRASIVLKNGIPERERIVVAVLRVVALKELEGLAKEVFSTVRVFKESTAVAKAAKQALMSTALPSDRSLLETKLDNDDPVTMQIAMAALMKLSDESWSDQLVAWAGNRNLDATARLDAAIRIANFGNRNSLKILLDLMQVETTNVRVRSNIALRKLTGQKFNFAAYDKPKKRAEVIDKWQAWIDENGENAELSFPITEIKLGRSHLNGNTLLAMGYKNRIVELDPDGKEIWSHDARGVWSAEKLESGNVLYSAYEENKVIEISTAGETVWEHPVPGVLNARLTESGTILAASHSTRKVLEIGRDKEVKWEYTCDTQCHDAIRLDNGNTLIGNSNRVIEVSPDKEIVWEHKVNQGYGIDVTTNGNVLVAQLGGSVIEVDRESREVIWEYETPNAVDVFRLENGNTLIVNAQSAMEVTPEKEVVWSKDGFNYGTVRK